jgi:hypothetical protein
MIIINVATSGSDVAGLLQRMQKTRPAMLKIGGVFSRHLDETLKNGREYMGNTMDPAEKWTRWATGKSESRPPLNVTGKFRRGHRVLSVSNSMVFFGPSSGMEARAELMLNGGTSKMPVQKSKIITGRDGSQYIRIKSKNGNWYTKKVIDGKVDIEVRAREYIGLTDKQADEAVDVLAKFLFN